MVILFNRSKRIGKAVHAVINWICGEMHKRLIRVDVFRGNIHKRKPLLEKILFVFTYRPASYVVRHVGEINVDVTARVNVCNTAVDIVAIGATVVHCIGIVHLEEGLVWFSTSCNVAALHSGGFKVAAVIVRWIALDVCVFEIDNAVIRVICLNKNIQEK